GRAAATPAIKHNQRRGWLTATWCVFSSSTARRNTTNGGSRTRLGYPQPRAPKPTATETGERQTLSEDSVRYGESRDLHCRRQGKGNPQVAHFLNRASSEESFELTTELRGAFIADAS